MTIEFMQTFHAASGENIREAKRVYRALVDLAIASGMETWILDPKLMTLSHEQISELPSPPGSYPGDPKRVMIPKGTMNQILDEGVLDNLFSNKSKAQERWVGGKNFLGKKGELIARLAVNKLSSVRVSS